MQVCTLPRRHMATDTDTMRVKRCTVEITSLQSPTFGCTQVSTWYTLILQDGLPASCGFTPVNITLEVPLEYRVEYAYARPVQLSLDRTPICLRGHSLFTGTTGGGAGITTRCSCGYPKICSLPAFQSRSSESDAHVHPPSTRSYLIQCPMRRICVTRWERKGQDQEWNLPCCRRFREL